MAFRRRPLPRNRVFPFFLYLIVESEGSNFVRSSFLHFEPGLNLTRPDQASHARITGNKTDRLPRRSPEGSQVCICNMVAPQAQEAAKSWVLKDLRPAAACGLLGSYSCGRVASDCRGFSTM